MKLRRRLLFAYLFLCRMVLGVTFLVSGFVKLADPMGMVHKLAAYGTSLELPWSDASIVWRIGAVALGGMEFSLGLYWLLGIKRLLTLRFTALLMVVMTGLTVWVYRSHPVADCGCFGDAIVLTDGETLAKNVVLLVLSLGALLAGRRYVKRLITERNAWLVSIYTIVYSLVVALYSLHYLPVLDFTPYRLEADLRSVVKGETPRAKTSPLSERDREVLSSFFAYDAATGDDATMPIVDHRGYSFLLIVPDVATADDGVGDRIADLYDGARAAGAPFYMLTASDAKGRTEWVDRTGAAYPMLGADITALRAMSRSNPGLLLLHDGVIVGKWSGNDLPELAEGQSPAQLVQSPRTSFVALGRLALWFLVPLFLVIVADGLWVGHKYFRHYRYLKRFNHKHHIMRKKIVAGNWKMNKTLPEGIALATELRDTLAADAPACGVIICTPYIHLAPVAELLKGSVIGLGAENCADKESGAYTGEVSAAMVKSTGAQYVILGHSERRAYYHETAEILKEKVALALEHGLDVIFCIGEVLEDREAGRQNEVVKAQLEGSLFGLTAEQLSHIILAYEPVWAIGTGKTATAEQAEEMHAFIRQTIADKFGAQAAEDITILYGGSCKPSNAKELFAKPDVDGGLIGGAALKAADFKGIIDAWKA